MPQQAWIQNARLRDNILFAKPFDAHLYAKVVDACALKADLAMLAAGDQTEIGEKVSRGGHTPSHFCRNNVSQRRNALTYRASI